MTGIAHRKKKAKMKVVCAKSGLVLKTDKCIEVRVDLDKACKYCKQCYGNISV